MTRLVVALALLGSLAACGEHKITDKNGMSHCVDSKNHFVSSSHCTK